MNKSSRFAGTSALLLLSAAYFTACSSDGSSPAGGQGGTAVGQSSTGGATGASGDLVGAMSLNFLSGGVNCPIPAGYDDFPSVSGGHPVTAAGVTATTPDNVTSPRGLVRVECSIGGSVLQAGISFHLGEVSMGFSANRTGTVVGNFSYCPLDPSYSGLTYAGTSTAPCTVTAISTTATGGLYSVSCPTLTGSDGTSCVLGASYVYFSGCTLR